jgi:hypothetical protein
MQGWKTWLAVIGMILYAVLFEGIYNNNWAKAIELIIAAMALIGLGSKLDKVRS